MKNKMICEFCQFDMVSFRDMDKYFHFLRHRKVRHLFISIREVSNRFLNFIQESFEESSQKHLEVMEKLLKLTHQYKIL